MLRTCEIYADEHKILFNAKKSQSLHFTKSSTSKDPQLFMNDGSIISYIDTGNHLGNTISIKSDKLILDNAVNELYMRTNCLLSDFSFSECSTLSHLFDTYYMNIYGSPLWKYYVKNLLEVFYVAWRKSLRRVWKISNVAHNNLLPFIHNCHPIDVILEKRCIKFVWSLYNSNYALYSNILLFSLQNGNSALGENVRYLMHKYDIVNSDWSQNIDILYSKVEVYINRLMNINHKCTGSVIRELCETRDICNTHFLSPMNCFI